MNSDFSALNNPILIKEGSIEECLTLSTMIPEFSDRKYDLTEYQDRLGNVAHLILVAWYDDQPAGFKVGYDRDHDGSFYSWMGGVLPDYRNLKIAKKLAEEQEIWAKSRGYVSIIFKTRNYLKSMLIFALKNGFNITGIQETAEEENYRIILKKIL